MTVQVAWPSLGRVDLYLAKDCADELGWVAEMAGAIDKLDIDIDYSDRSIKFVSAVPYPLGSGGGKVNLIECTKSIVANT